MTQPKSRFELRVLGICGNAWPGTNGFVRCMEPYGHATPHQPDLEGLRWLAERKARYHALVARV